MSEDDDMAIMFYKQGDASDLAVKIITLLESTDLQQSMSNHNYEAGLQMAMANVARTYIRWFELHKLKREIAGKALRDRVRSRLCNAWRYLGLRMSFKRWSQSGDVTFKDDVLSTSRSSDRAIATMAALSLKHQAKADKENQAV